jgi:hypothetical protein
MDKISGKSYSLFEKIRLGIYGSPKYTILELNPEDLGISDGKSNDLLHGNFELKKEGMAFYFRYLNDEYAIVARYNQITFQTNDKYFELQMGKHAIKMEIKSKKGHLNFLRNFAKHRSYDTFPHSAM